MGQTLAQRLAAGKGLAPLHDGIFAWSRAVDGHEFVCSFDQVTALINSLSATPVVTQQNAAYTPAFTDAFTIIEFTGAGTQLFTMPTDAAQPAMGVGSVIGFQQIGAGAVTWPAAVVPGVPTLVAGVTYDVPAALTIQRFVYYTWRKRAANEWILS